jgi:hypothetical protein
MVKKVGSGTFGDVFCATCEGFSQQIAIKIMRTYDEDMINECKILR